MASTVLFNGQSYVVSDTDADAIRELAGQMTKGDRPGFMLSLSRDGLWHRLFVTQGAPLTLID